MNQGVRKLWTVVGIQLIELNNRVESLYGTVRFVGTDVRFWNLARCCKLNLVLQNYVSEDYKYDD